MFNIKRAKRKIWNIESELWILPNLLSFLHKSLCVSDKNCQRKSCAHDLVFSSREPYRAQMISSHNWIFIDSAQASPSSPRHGAKYFPTRLLWVAADTPWCKVLPHWTVMGGCWAEKVNGRKYERYAISVSELLARILDMIFNAEKSCWIEMFGIVIWSLYWICDE